MPNMFSRRRGSSVSRPVDANTSAAAATAASSAFLSRPSNHNLSSAAAAAALTSRPTTPTAVGNIQTKRMVRRGSNSSVGSASVIGSATRGGVGRAGLQRQNSGGSMTERTFRSPSPGRPESVAAAPDAPPVPKVPAGVRGGHKRAASQQPVQRVLSPTPRGSRGVSVDRAPAADRSSNRLSDVYEAEREDNNSSVNFSRPMSAMMAGSPGTNKPVHSGGSWFTSPSGNSNLSNVKPARGSATANGLASHEVSGIQQGLNAAANRPVAKKQLSQNAQGSHLARANNDPPASEAMDTSDTIMVYDPHSRTFVAHPRPGDEAPEPASPTLPRVPAPKPGTYDPHTRSIVPAPQPARQAARRTTSSGDMGSDSDTAPVKKKSNLLSVNTQPAPPPRNPARSSSADSSPISPRAAGTLQKQPSVVREDPEGEEVSARWQPTPKPKVIQTSAGPARAYATQSSTPRMRSASLDVPRSGSESSGRGGRGGSISPSRNAHFSVTPIVEGTKHVPHRGVSPVKSAMKHSHSPSSSIRTASPNTAASPAGKATTAGSETSETPSLGPPEGSRKKNVRVSFDAQPHEIPDEIGGTPTRLPVSRERSPAVDDDMEELMKPRPALPSFGSVRKGRQPDLAEKVTERPPDRHEASSDRVVGGIFAGEAAKRESEREEPLSPEVTSREGGGYGSDSSEEEPARPSAQDAVPSDSVVGSSTVGKGNADVVTQFLEKPVPQLSFQPPTPGTEEEVKLGEAKSGEQPAPVSPNSPRMRKSWESFNIPGSWGAQDDEEEDKEEKTDTAVPAVSGMVLAQATEPEPVTSKPALEPVAARTLAAQLSDISESDSDDSAAFSDAAEEQSDMEGGFASLNAILENPSPNARAKTAVAMDDSPPQADKQQEGDWSQATAYWSRLSRQQREQIEREHLSSDDEARPAPVAKPRKKKSAMKQTPPAEEPRQQASKPEQPTLRKSLRNSQEPAPATDAQEERVHMRSSMRGAPSPSPAPQDDKVHMRSSMRDRSSGASGGSGMRNSMRGPPAARPQSASSALTMGAAGSAMSRRRDSNDTLQDGPFPIIGNRNATQPRPASSRQQPAPAPVANDSDSESSFKKSRRGGRRASNATVDSQAGRYSMKRSMRAGSIDSTQQIPPPTPTPASKAKSSSFSVRSLSPTGSFFGRNRQNLRESMRPGSVDGGKTLRGQNGMAKNRTMRSSSAQAPKPAPKPSSSASRFRSKFAQDSDDEDDGGRGRGRSMFSSRFADSDDEDDGPAPRSDLAPVRGIPKRKGQEDGDSTDLSDEGDGRVQATPLVPNSADIERAMAAARRNLGMTNGDGGAAKEGTTLAQGSLRHPDPEPERPQSPGPDSTPKRRGFMGSILRRNRGSQMSVQQLPPPSSPAPAIQISSPPPSTNSPRPMSPTTRGGKLIRRASAQPGTSAAQQDSDWPLPSPGFKSEHSAERPATADGVHEQAVRLARTMRSEHVGFVDGVKVDDGSGSPVGKRGGKKKKFGMLRRAFGLDD